MSFTVFRVFCSNIPSEREPPRITPSAPALLTPQCSAHLLHAYACSSRLALPHDQPRCLYIRACHSTLASHMLISCHREVRRCTDEVLGLECSNTDDLHILAATLQLPRISRILLRGGFAL